MKAKFLYIQEGSDEGTLIASDGGVAIIWHNEEHLVGQAYQERLSLENLKVSYANAFEKMVDSSSNSSMFDFENEDEVLPNHIKELAEWLVAFTDLDFFDNLKVIVEKELSCEQIEEEVQSFLDNDDFRNAA